MIRLPEIKEELADRTMIINYGETGRRSTGLLSYTIEVTIQILSAKNNEVICILTGEGIGETEADDVRIAINRCLEEMYKKQ
jgi:ribose 5-phosphate isomerase RpiB